jgi:hypothetical protein
MEEKENMVKVEEQSSSGAVAVNCRPNVVKMGFEKNQRICKVMNNQHVDDLGCHFRSKLEARYANYLELLKKAGEIVGWEYEKKRFALPEGDWLVDFTVHYPEHTEYHECKGYLQSHDRARMKLARDYYPDAILVLISQSKLSANNLRIVSKYLDRVCVERNRKSGYVVETIWSR